MLFANPILDPAENMKELLSEITRKEQMATGKRMGYLNNFAQVETVLKPCYILSACNLRP